MIVPFGSYLLCGRLVGYVFLRDGVTVAPRTGMVVVWPLGVVATGLSTTLLLQMAGRLPVRSWEQTGLS